MKKFEFNHSGILDRIVTKCTVDVSDYETIHSTSSKEEIVNALWDTGSTVTVLSENLVQRLGLIASDISQVSGWDGKPFKTNTYNIDIAFDDVRIEFIDAVRGPLKNIDMIIGMDVLGQGNLQISHPEYSTKLSFFLE